MFVVNIVAECHILISYHFNEVQEARLSEITGQGVVMVVNLALN